MPCVFCRCHPRGFERPAAADQVRGFFCKHDDRRIDIGADQVRPRSLNSFALVAVLTAQNGGGYAGRGTSGVDEERQLCR